MRLHLGVLEVPYSDGKKSTGDVAEILEEKYHIMELFAEHVGPEAIAKAFEDSAQDAIQDLFSGAPTSSVHLTLAATEGLQDEFMKFIDTRQLDGVVQGVPTQASLKGVNHRLKRPYVKSNPERPSFKDTGLYEDSFRVWTDD